MGDEIITRTEVHQFRPDAPPAETAAGISAAVQRFLSDPLVMSSPESLRIEVRWRYIHDDSSDEWFDGLELTASASVHRANIDVDGTLSVSDDSPVEWG